MATKRERVSVVVVFEGKILCFVGIDPKSGKRFYFLPGGEIEPEETEIKCGERETLEETGYRVRLEKDSRLTKAYPFFWNGKNYDCITHFYRGHLDEVFHVPLPVSDQDYNKGPVWIPTGKIHALFEYSKEIHDAVAALID
ncbi:MAG: NUDIX domain-containing protein [Pseudobdellovibrionaceae bacterium]